MCRGCVVCLLIGSWPSVVVLLLSVFVLDPWYLVHGMWSLESYEDSFETPWLCHVFG